jgi:hypothetical protein
MTIFDGLICEDEIDVRKEGMKWTALAHVHKSNSFGAQMFEQHMCVPWIPTKDIKFISLEDFLF